MKEKPLTQRIEEELDYLKKDYTRPKANGIFFMIYVYFDVNSEKKAEYLGVLNQIERELGWL